MEGAERRSRTVAARQDGLLHREQALANGMTSSAIARRTGSGAWTIVLPRVYLLDGAGLTWTRRTRAASLWAGARSALSHQTAATLWRLEGFPSAAVCVTTTRGLRAASGISVHRASSLEPADVEPVDGMAVTTPARTLLDLAAVEPPDKVGLALDHALTSRLVSLPKLRWFVDTRGRRGASGHRGHAPAALGTTSGLRPSGEPSGAAGLGSPAARRRAAAGPAASDLRPRAHGRPGGPRLPRRARRR